tara:strand:- start:4833 stop:5882 length:1050 start_codon:yes stop_codon:yes gene_type:complete
MKTFLLKLVIFSILVFAFCFALSELQFSDDFLIEKTKGTAYEKVGWNINMIHNHKDEIENSIVFFGSSYVLNGVNDSILNSKGIKSVNLAIKHNGNDLSLYFLKRIIPLKPKEVVFLKGKTAFRNLHKLAPLLYRPSNLIADGQNFNLTFVSYLFKRTKLSLDYIYFEISKKPDDGLIDKNKFGIRYEESFLSENDFYDHEKIKGLQKEEENFNLYRTNFLYKNEAANPSFFNRIKALKRKWTLKYYSQNDWITNFGSQEHFIKKAKEICVNNEILFTQIYMPVVSDVVSDLSGEETFYMPLESDAHTIYHLKNYSFLNDNTFWTDKHHLTKKGSIVFTNEFISTSFSK